MEHLKNLEKLNYTDHFKETKKNNQQLIDVLKNQIHISNPENTSIGIVGSDSRLENSLLSPIECVTIFNQLQNKPDINIDDAIKQIIHPKIEEIILQNNNPFYMELNEFTNLFSPTRLLDYETIKGNPEIYKQRLEQAKNILFTSEGKKILKSSRTQTNTHSKIMETGNQKYRGCEIQHYDTEQGIATYDPQNGLWGFKQGLPRTLQFATTRDLLKLIRDGKITPQELINIPKNIPEKLEFMQQNNLSCLTNDEKNELADNYMFFSHLYHKSQVEFQKGNKQIQFEPKEITERLKSTKKIYDAHTYFIKT